MNNPFEETFAARKLKTKILAINNASDLASAIVLEEMKGGQRLLKSPEIRLKELIDSFVPVYMERTLALISEAEQLDNGSKVENVVH